ncbi:MAG: FtsX-like permease family protein [Gemmatimonas sp.]|nr:FtsX-like permease family protein [Gemmatimonas sp.]
MSARRGGPGRFRWPWRRRGHIAREVDEELAFHLEMREKALVESGMAPGEARERALWEFGDVEKVRRSMRRTDGRIERVRRWIIVFEEPVQDARFALRSFRTDRSSLLLVGAVLALAIAAGNTTFSVISGVLLRSLPYQEAERLVNVRVTPREMEYTPGEGATLAAPVVELASSTRAFAGTAYLTSNGSAVLTGPVEPQRVESAWQVEPAFFAVMGAAPLLGRILVASDAQEGARVGVISHRTWRTRLGGRPDVLGQVLRLDDEPFEVVGVMPPGFEFPNEAEVWRPAAPLDPVEVASERVQGGHWFIGRLAEGVALEGARGLLDTGIGAAATERPSLARWRANLQPLRDDLVGPVERPLWLLLGAVALVLLMACVNVGAVLLARGVARRRELATRLSLGASRARVARQLVAESVVLTAASGAVGLLVTLWAVPAVARTLADDIPRAAEIGIDGRVLSVAVLASLLTGVIAGLLPLLHLSLQSPHEALKDGGVGSGTMGWRVRFLEGSVALQVAFGLVVVSVACILLWNFVRLTRLELGFEADRVTAAQIHFSAARYASLESQQAFLDAVLERAKALPGVEAAALSDGFPFRGGGVGTAEVDGVSTPERPIAVWNTSVTPDYFRVMGISLVRGRLASDAGGREAVVNEAFVRRLLPDGEPLGRRFEPPGSDELWTVVGVVTDTRQQDLRAPPPPQVYLPFTPSGRDFTPYQLFVRHVEPSADAAPDLDAVTRSVDPTFVPDRVVSLRDNVFETVAQERLYGLMLGAFATLALLIAALGAFGLGNFAVRRQTRELGIRLALGESAVRLQSAVVTRLFVVVAAGVVLGLGVATVALPLLRLALPELEPWQPTLLLLPVCLFLVTGIAAAIGPARRAGRVDPIRTLQAE